MSGITRFQPLQALAGLDAISEAFFEGFTVRQSFGAQIFTPHMRLDVTEDERAYQVKAELPGVSRDGINVSVHGNLVFISAEVKKEADATEGDKVIRCERYFGPVSRSFTVPQDVDESATAVRYCNGVLELTLPKRPAGSAPRTKVA